MSTRRARSPSPLHSRKPMDNDIRYNTEGSSHREDCHRKDERGDDRHRRDNRDERGTGGSSSRRPRSPDREHERYRPDERLSRLTQRRSRSRTRSASPRRHEKRNKDSRRWRSRSSSDSESSSSEESDSADDRRRRRREKRRKEEKEEKRRKKERKKEKKARKEKLKNTAAVTAQWGKYGLISETDLNKKHSEFRTWLVEERKINPETVSKEKTRKEFAVFVEDYNTATLPHEKFYDMGKYEVKMNMIRSGQTIPDEVGYDPMADMKAHATLMKGQHKEKETFLSRNEIAELRRIEAERIEIGKRRVLGLDVPRNMGVRTEERHSRRDGTDDEELV